MRNQAQGRIPPLGIPRYRPLTFGGHPAPKRLTLRELPARIAFSCAAVSARIRVVRISGIIGPRSAIAGWLAGSLLALFLALSGQAAETRKTSSWITLTGCRFLSQESGDGDSFHVKYGQREFIFRLYFVDAPEVNDDFPERNQEQAEYFGVTLKQNRQAGEEARAFAAEWLKKPFIVTTRWQNAMGRSKLPRYYALVEVDGRDLADLLVSRGLARAKGTLAVMPDGEKAKDHLEKLRKLESEARTKRLGIWAHSKKAAR